MCGQWNAANWALVFSVTIALSFAGCRGQQYTRVMDNDDDDMVGSHTAGAETYKPLIAESVSKLLGRHASEVVHVSATNEVGMPVTVPGRRRVAFVSVENASGEELGDFKEQIFEHIDSAIASSDVYSTISKRFIDAAMSQNRMRPEAMFLPEGRRQFAATLEQMEQPVDYLLFAKITSGTTQANKDYQRDYLLTLEMVDIHTGEFDKESATLRKGYHSSVLSRVFHR